MTSQNPVDIVPEPTRSHGKGRVVLKVILALLLALAVAAAVYAANLGASVARMGTAAAGLERAATNIEVALANTEVASIAANLGAVEQDILAIDAELSTWEWDVASVLPVYGADVQTARRLVDVAVGLMDEAVTPAARLLERYVALPSDFDGIAQGLELVDEARALVDTATAALAGASEVLAQLPAFHVAQLNDLVLQARSALAQALDALAELTPYLETYDSIKGVIGALGA